jgi:glycosyltransferase involved in cell wall biosynthesis
LVAWEPQNRWHVVDSSLQVVRLARWADVVVAIKPRMPLGVARVLASIAPVVVDADDAVWEWSPEARRRFHALARGAAAITVGSDHLAGQVTAFSEAPVTVIRPAVDPECYRAARSSSASRTVVIGWMGTPRTRDFTDEFTTAIRALHASGRARLKIVGGSRPAALPDADLEPWSLDTQAAALSSFDIGVMPLHDDPESLGRCGLKVIEYMAASLPVVASRIGVGPELVEEGKTGFLATSTDDWVDALSELCESAELRRDLGAAGRRQVEREFSIERAAETLNEVLTAL